MGEFLEAKRWVPVRADLTQQRRYVSAAIMTAIVDVACGYAAMLGTMAALPERSERAEGDTP